MPTATQRDDAALNRRLSEAGLALAGLQHSHPNLFSGTCVRVEAAAAEAMATLIAAIESVIALPAYQQQVLAQAPELARQPRRERGVFYGYDFHLSPDGPQLIEINTNAGGALLSACLRSAWGDLPAPGLAGLEAAWVAMFGAEYRLQHPDGGDWQHLVIVDEAPLEQYLAPEFRLFQALLQRQAGRRVSIADPAALVWDGRRLSLDGQPIDLVYNRLTDFSFATPACQALRAAYVADAVGITPHPAAHALYADKRNLILLSDPVALAALGVPDAVQRILLHGIPPTRAVRAAEAEQWWQQRRQWFFKPAAGFGSRAAYRGDKLTKRVFEEILQGDYIAQAIVPPPEWPVMVDGAVQGMKFDLRNYVYDGQVQLLSARLYQGQTTNFRTPGGGFAPVQVGPV